MEANNVRVAEEEATCAHIFGPCVGAVGAVDVDVAGIAVDAGTCVDARLKSGEAEDAGRDKALLLRAGVVPLAEGVTL